MDKLNVVRSDFATLIVNHPKSEDRTANVTAFSTARKKLFSAATKLNTDGFCLSRTLVSTEDNVERIRRFKEVWFYQLKGLLDGILLNPLEPPNKPVCRNGSGDSWIACLKKDEFMSQRLRELGNDYFKKNDSANALRCYTLACSYAPKGSKSEMLAYSNRSACFSSIGEYERCLQEIERFEALFVHYTDEVHIEARVADRKSKCLEMIKTKKNGHSDDGNRLDLVEFAGEYFWLKKPNQAVPSAADFIGIKNDDKRGRNVVNAGKEPIKPGTLLIVEEPYAHVLLKALSFTAKHCNACLRDLNGSGVPCEGCVFALYCSKECATSSHHNLHAKYECKMSPYLFELNMNRMIHLSLSILLNLSPEELLSHLRSDPPPPDQIPGFSSDGIYDSTSYSTIYNLVYHNEIVSEQDLTGYCADAVLVTEILDATTDYFSSLNLTQIDTISVKDEFSKLLLLHQLNLPCNAHSLYKLDIRSKNPKGSEIANAQCEEIGAGAFPLLSLINHSCDPNVVRITLPKGVNAVIAIQHIPPGQELLDNYGAHYAVEDRASRQTHLQSMYNFKCDCPACENDYPSIDKLDMIDEVTAVNICSRCSVLSSGPGLDLKLKAQKNVGDLLVCPKCDGTVSRRVCTQSYHDMSKKYEAALKSLSGNKPIIGLQTGVECLEYFDSNFMKPFKYINYTQEIIKQALFLLARRTLE